MNTNENPTATDNYLFDPFPAPRTWHFGGDAWAGMPHGQNTSDYLFGAPDQKGQVASNPAAGNRITIRKERTD